MIRNDRMQLFPSLIIYFGGKVVSSPFAGQNTGQILKSDLISDISSIKVTMCHFGVNFIFEFLW